MMPDLGKYAVEVMGSYGVSLLALALLCVVYIRRSSSNSLKVMCPSRRVI